EVGRVRAADYRAHGEAVGAGAVLPGHSAAAAAWRCCRPPSKSAAGMSVHLAGAAWATYSPRASFSSIALKAERASPRSPGTPVAKYTTPVPAARSIHSPERKP